MKTNLSLILLILTFLDMTAFCQGTFQDLNFESATVPAGTQGASPLPVSELLPGWGAYFSSGGVNYPQTDALYDGISGGGSMISVIDKSASAFGPLQGKYSAFLFGGIGDGEGDLYSASISQTGFVPAGTQSLVFDAFVFAAPFIVTLGGQSLNMTPIATFANYTEYGANIPSGLVDHSETLIFTEPASTTTIPTELELDNISFSQTAVAPEPNAVILTGVGGLILAARRRFCG